MPKNQLQVNGSIAGNVDEMLHVLIARAQDRPPRHGDARFEVSLTEKGARFFPPPDHARGTQAMVEAHAMGGGRLFISSARMPLSFFLFVACVCAILALVGFLIVRQEGSLIVAIAALSAVSAIIIGAALLVGRVASADADAQMRMLLAAAFPNHAVSSKDGGYFILRR